jgi:hypothetical protein
LTGVLGLVAAFTLLESNVRAREKDRMAAEVERIRMSESDVLGWQLELVVDGGFLKLNEALPFLQKMKFTIKEQGRVSLLTLRKISQPHSQSRTSRKRGC